MSKKINKSDIIRLMNNNFNSNELSQLPHCRKGRWLTICVT